MPPFHQPFIKAEVVLFCDDCISRVTKFSNPFSKINSLLSFFFLKMCSFSYGKARLMNVSALLYTAENFEIN